MTPESRVKLKGMLIEDEDCKLFPYTDTTNHLSIGVGRNLSERGISSNEAMQMLDNDIMYFTAKLDSLFDFFSQLDDNRKIVLINICFNVGVNGFLGFSRMLQFVKERDFEKASHEILQSKAASQCPNRYQRLAYVMKTGEL